VSERTYTREQCREINPEGCYVIRDTSGKVLRYEPAPRSLTSYRLAQQKLAARNREIAEIMNGPNPFTQEELKAIGL